MATLGRESLDLPNMSRDDLIAPTPLRLRKNHGSSWLQKSENARFWSPKSGHEPGTSTRERSISKLGVETIADLRESNKCATCVRVKKVTKTF